MAKLSGSDVKLYIDGVAVGGETGVDVSISKDQIEVTDKASTGRFKERLKNVGEKDWSVSFNGFQDPSGTWKPSVLLAMLDSNSDIVAKISNELLGDEYLTGNIIPGEINFSNPKNEAAGLTFSAVGNGQIQAVVATA